VGCIVDIGRDLKNIRMPGKHGIIRAQDIIGMTISQLGGRNELFSNFCIIMYTVPHSCYTNILQLPAYITQYFKTVQDISQY